MSREGQRFIGGMQAVIVILILSIGWFSCVLGAAWGIAWLGPAVVSVLILLHLLYSRTWRRDLVFMLALGLVGAIVETLFLKSGLISYAGQGESSLAPVWVVVLWAHFGTMRHATLRLLFGRPMIAALSGAVVAPLVYSAGAALGAASFAPPSWRALTMIAVTWALVVPMASFFAWRGTPLQHS